MSTDGEDDDGRLPFDRRFFPAPKQRASTGAPRPLGPLETVRASRHAQAALRNELELLRGATEGMRNKQLNGSAFNLAQLCAGGSLDSRATWAALESEALSIGLTPAETQATLRSAFEAGQREPRVAGDLTPFARMAEPPAPVLPLRREPAADPLASDAADPEKSDESDEPDPVEQAALDAARAVLLERFPVIDWHELFTAQDEQEWIIEPLLPARRLVALFSAPKVGKSLLMLELAVAIARGTDVLGRALGDPRRVLYIDFENDPRGDIRVRLEAMGLTQWQLEDLRYLSFPTLAHLDTFVGGLELMQLVELYDCEVVVIDTVSRAVGGDENSNDTWLGFYRNTGLRLKQAGVACIRLDHTGKDAEKGMRGGSAKYGDVDAVWSMTKLTETTFQLECTANRLPIPEKRLVLHRETVPRLHHRVDASGMNAAFELLVAEASTLLDLAHVPYDKGRDFATDALKAKGYTVPKFRPLTEAIRRRKLSPAPGLPLGPLGLIDPDEEDDD